VKETMIHSKQIAGLDVEPEPEPEEMDEVN
jgi:hypothetical protein